MFYLYHHHDLERLLDLLAALQSHHAGPPLAADTVLVPNRGVGRWLQMRMAERHGVAADLEFPLPARFFWQLLSRSLPDSPDSSAYEQEHLRWHLYAALPEIAREVPRLARYLSGGSEIGRLQLAERLADVFDEYLIFRRDMLAAWERGAGEHRPPADWQAPVWRALVRRLGTRHRAQLTTELLEAVARGGALDRSRWPQRVYCFALGNLPPDYLRLLYALGRECDVHFLLPNPSEGYWGDIRARRVRLLALEEPSLAEEERIAGEHPLLAALGRSGRDLLRVLYSEELSAIHEPELGPAMDYTPPGDDTLLHRIQSGILRLHAQPSLTGMDAQDHSLQIHACHGPLRELQVLHDQLLHLLASEPTLEPRDVMVLVPDVAAYAPAIHSVFGSASEGRRLPYTVSDQPMASVHPIIQTFRALLALPNSRWTASEIMAIAAVPAVMRRYRLDAADHDRLCEWLEQAGVRWGLDADSRALVGAGRWAQNSWRAGMDRLLLGVGLADDATLVDGVAPYTDIEGTATGALGRLWLLVDALARWAEMLRQPAGAGVWRDRLSQMLEQLLLPDPNDHAEVRALDLVFEALRTLDGAERCMAGQWLSVAAVREVLHAALLESAQHQQWLGGGVSFCGMVPLRTVPVRVIALLGLNDGDFPRQDAHASINLVRLYPRIGDRSRRDDDRLLFLQSLVSAQDVLYLSYTGQDVRSGDALPPSTLIGELLEFLHHFHFPMLSAAELRRQIVTEQPMQPFSPRYLEPPGSRAAARVFTFDRGWLAAAEAMGGPRTAAVAFADGSTLAQSPPELVELRALQKFFEHPARFFLRDVLQIPLEPPADRLADEEPLALDSLSEYQLRQRLFARACMEGTLPQMPDALLRAQGVLPPAPLDDDAYARLARDVDALLPLWRDWCAQHGPSAEALNVSVAGGVRISGRLSDVWPDGLRRIRAGKLGMRYQIACWIDYLMLRAAGLPGALHMAGLDRDGSVCVLRATIAEAVAADQLARLVNLFQEGHTQPLPFMPDLAQRYLERTGRGHDPAAALAHCNDLLRNPYQPRYELGDPYFALVVRAPDYLGRDPDSAALCRIAAALCAPMLQYLEAAT
jgi:exodeoxyribonuclease V gamma subunit